MSDGLTEERIVEVVGEAIAAKTEAITTPLIERLDALDAKVDEVAAKAAAATPAAEEKPDEAATKAITDAVDAAVAPIKEELAAAKTANDELLTTISEKLDELDAAPKSIQDDPDGKGEPKPDPYERDALGRRIRKATK